MIDNRYLGADADMGRACRGLALATRKLTARSRHSTVRWFEKADEIDTKLDRRPAETRPWVVVQ